MFGFSLPKLLVLVAVIGAVWYGFKLIGRLDQQRRVDGRSQGAAKPAKRPRRKSEPDEAQDMVQCPHCKAYYAMGSTHRCDT